MHIYTSYISLSTVCMLPFCHLQFFFQNRLFQKNQEYDQSVSQFVIVEPGPGVIKLFSCSTQLSTKFQLLIKTKILTKKFLALSLSGVVFIMLINVKMPTIVGILTFTRGDQKVRGKVLLNRIAYIDCNENTQT